MDCIYKANKIRNFNMELSILEMAIVIGVGAVVFWILFKLFRWAIEAVIVFVLVLIGIYIALRVLNYNDAGNQILQLLNQIKTMLGF